MTLHHSSSPNNTSSGRSRRWLRLCLQASMAGLLVLVYFLNQRLRQSSPAIGTSNSATATTAATRVRLEKPKGIHHHGQQQQKRMNLQASQQQQEKGEALGSDQVVDDKGDTTEAASTSSPPIQQKREEEENVLSAQESQEILLQAARARVQELEAMGHSHTTTTTTKKGKNKKKKKSNDTFKIQDNRNNQPQPPHDGLPSLESLIGRNRKHPQIVADVQFLLDFAVVGFGKCGTTTLLQWLSSPTNSSTSAVQVRAPSYEAQFLVNRRPTQLVRKLHQFAQEEEEARQQDPDARIVKGFKNPSDIRRPHSRALLAKYWPATPLIVTVRHPVQWMVSLYNYFKIEKGRHKANVTATQMVDRSGRDNEGNTRHYVSTAKGEFHAILAELGKTRLRDSGEWKLLRPWLDPSTKETLLEHKLPNPIFFMELQQLADKNATRAQQFAHDLENFIGLPRGHLPPVLHVRPNTQHIKLKETDHLKLDICTDEYAPVLQEMMEIARAASQWFRRYFMTSPEVVVSSPEYLTEILQGWMKSPCENEKDKLDEQEEDQEEAEATS